MASSVSKLNQYLKLILDFLLFFRLDSARQALGSSCGLVADLAIMSPYAKGDRVSTPCVQSLYQCQCDGCVTG